MRATCSGIVSPQLWTVISVRFQPAFVSSHVVSDCQRRTSKIPQNSSYSRPWNAIHSSACLSGSCVLISSSRMRNCQYNNHRERNQFLPPTSHIIAAHLCTEPTLVRQQLKPGPLVEGWAHPNHRSIKLIFICSPLAAFHRHASSGDVDCVNCLLAVITIISARDALHMTETNWAVILVIRSLMNELANK